MFSSSYFSKKGTEVVTKKELRFLFALDVELEHFKVPKQ